MVQATLWMNKNTGLAAELPSNLQAKFVEAGVGVWTGAFCCVVWCAGSGGWVTQCGVVLGQFVGSVTSTKRWSFRIFSPSWWGVSLPTPAGSMWPGDGVLQWSWCVHTHPPRCPSKTASHANPRGARECPPPARRSRCVVVVDVSLHHVSRRSRSCITKPP